MDDLEEARDLFERSESAKNLSAKVEYLGLALQAIENIDDPDLERKVENIKSLYIKKIMGQICQDTYSTMFESKDESISALFKINEIHQIEKYIAREWGIFESHCRVALDHSYGQYNKIYK